MQKLWRFVGRVVFWLSWPAQFIYLRVGRRTRVLILCEDKVLVVKGWISSGAWMLPGGGLHFRENPAAGAVREVREETGLKLQPEQLQSLILSSTTEHGLRFIYYGFVAKLDSLPPLKLRHFEISEACLLPINAVSTTNTSGTLRAVLEYYRRSLIQ